MLKLIIKRDFVIIKKIKRVLVFLLLLYTTIVLLSCNDKNGMHRRMTKLIPRDLQNEIIVPIKLPSVPYVLKYNIKSMSYNKEMSKNIENPVGEITKLSSIEETTRKSVGHKVYGAEYYPESYDKKSVWGVDTGGESSKDGGVGDSVKNSGKAIWSLNEDLYGICEIVKFDNQIKTSDKERCSGYLYYQLKVTKKGNIYVKPKFKIKNNEGLVMSIFLERTPDLYNLNENEIIEGYIFVSEQKYSETYELIIE